MIDKERKLSEHFTLGELTKTKFVTPDGNEPPEEAVKNLQNICENWLEELRFIYNTEYVLRWDEDYDTSPQVVGVGINMGYRSQQVSEAMLQSGEYNPSKTSNHLTGCAVDIRCAGVEQAIRYMTILLNLSDEKDALFDELILERSGGRYWIHFAVRPSDNRSIKTFIIK
jgi:uncharacterized protein YcbK (DUF882 family)